MYSKDKDNDCRYYVIKICVSGKKSASSGNTKKPKAYILNPTWQWSFFQLQARSSPFLYAC